VTITPNISTIYEFFAAGYQSLLKSHPAFGNRHAARECVVAEPPWRNRHRLSSSEFPTAPIFPRYQY
jgi:hypothetical protein